MLKSEYLEPSGLVDNVQRLELPTVRVVDGLDVAADHGVERVGAVRGRRGVEHVKLAVARAADISTTSRSAGPRSKRLVAA